MAATPDLPTAPPPVAPPDPASRAGLACPLCDYSLRGLVDPRCPECGYAFDWADLTDPDRRLHPYLFEHHPERNVRSFVRTLVGGLRPVRFWRDLRPSQPSRPRRLLLYALVPLVLLLAAAAAQTVWRGIRLADLTAQNRAGWTTAANLPGDNYVKEYLRLRGLTLRQALDAMFPLPMSRAFVRQCLSGRWTEVPPVTVRIVVPLAAWPALTLGALLVFQQSMRRARVRPVHVARCVVYSADVTTWAAAALLVALAAALAAELLGHPVLAGRWEAFEVIERGSPVAVAGLLAVAAVRLLIAYRLYLRMDRPVRTILATQVIVALVLLTYYVEAYNRHW